MLFNICIFNSNTDSFQFFYRNGCMNKAPAQSDLNNLHKDKINAFTIKIDIKKYVSDNKVFCSECKLDCFWVRDPNNLALNGEYCYLPVRKNRKIV